jgi:membrane-bound lytic murein transglycosylase B
LDNEKQDLENLVVIQNLQRRESSVIKKDKDWLLHLTETEYQKYLSERQERQQKATEIRSRIFELIGIPEAPTFGEAYEIAKYVSGITGVRPALLLAVLKQESNIGKNVGQCYLKNPSTGSGVVVYNSKSVAKVMKPSRDVSPFLDITQALGRDPYNTPVSCPMSYGWGGAMGPAQFIPSTWKIYKDRLSNITGKPGDPWNIKDAFLAAGLYLSDYGAVQQTYNGEWKAAMIYFSGTSRRTQYNGWGFYGDSVMRITEGYEDDIAALESN